MFDYYAPACRTVERRRDNLRTSRCRMLLFGQADHHIGIKFAIGSSSFPIQVQIEALDLAQYNGPSAPHLNGH